MYVDCERCGERTERIETASHAFCARCRSTASTGTRDSSELLFSLAPPARKDDDELTQLAPREAEREEVPALMGLGTPPPMIVAPRQARHGVAWSMAAAAFAVVLVGSSAFAWRAWREPAAPVARDTRTPARGAEPLRRAPTAERLEPAPEPIAEVAPAIGSVSPAPSAPESIAPASIAPESIAPESIAPAPRPRVSARARQPRTSDDASAPALRRPSRAEVNAALGALAERVARCSDGGHGTVEARVIFVGASGRAIHAEVTDASVPPAVRSCVARALREAELSAFDGPRLTVLYPFRF